MVLAAMTACGSGNDGSADASRSLDPHPLSAYLPMTSVAEQEDTVRENRRDVETRTAACMKTFGFEYYPVDPDDGTPTQTWSSAASGWLTVADAKKYGYGINVTNPDVEIQPMPTARDDPNEEYRNSLSPAEAKDYDEALNGKDGGGDRDPSQPQDPAVAGCFFASLAANQQEGVLPSDDFSGLLSDLDALTTLEATDPGIAALDTEWLACMEDAGYPDWATPDEARSYFQDRNAEVFGPEGAAVTDPRVVALADEEITVAVADATCSEQIDYAPRSAAIWAALENEFITTHRKELDAFREAMAENN